MWEACQTSNQSDVCCDKCDCWLHIYCNNSCKKACIKIKKDCILWYCKSCLKKEISFSDLHDIGFSAFTDGILILPKKNMYESKIVEKLNTFTENEDRKCKYYMHDQIKYIRLRKAW